jgi:chloramphenicol 3-O-phosphotransferase
VERLPKRLVAAAQDAPARCGPVSVIAIDGGAAAGKTGLAERLSALLPDAAVLHLDDLLDGWAGQFGYRDRLHTEVLVPLAADRPAGYRRYDWTLGRFADRVTLPVPRYLLVEGVSALWGCSPFWSVGVFLDVPRTERERRWAARDGDPQPEWRAWLDAEDRFFAEHPVPAEAWLLAPGRTLR